MAELFGRIIGRKNLQGYTGRLDQVAGIRLVELADGPERGVRVAEFRTGSGLCFDVLLERGMDIGHAEFRGLPLAWHSPAGFPHPAYCEPQGLGWLRTFGGGLMAGCGLTHLGAPDVDAGEELGLHGRLSFLPAWRVRAGEQWDGDECEYFLEGEARQARLFGENLRLARRISTGLGKSAISLRDEVENLGDASCPLMILYHINLGFPLLSEESYLEAGQHPVKPRDAAAEPGSANWARFQKPTPSYAEQVFYHDLPADSGGWAEITLVNPSLGLKLAVRFHKPGLPNLIEWKQMGHGAYVLGLEPANCFVEGRSKDRARGVLQFIEPGETRQFAVDIAIQPVK